MTTFAQRQTVTYVALDAEFERRHPNYATNNCVYIMHLTQLSIMIKLLIVHYGCYILVIVD